MLISSGSDMLVYAGEETPLGIDYSSSCYVASGWRDSENWLGTVLMSVRDKIVCI